MRKFFKSIFRRKTSVNTLSPDHPEHPDHLQWANCEGTYKDCPPLDGARLQHGGRPRRIAVSGLSAPAAVMLKKSPFPLSLKGRTDRIFILNPGAFIGIQKKSGECPDTPPFILSCDTDRPERLRYKDVGRYARPGAWKLLIGTGLASAARTQIKECSQFYLWTLFLLKK